MKSIILSLAVVFASSNAFSGAVKYSTRPIDKKLEEAVLNKDAGQVKAAIAAGANVNASVFHDDDDDYGSILGNAIDSSTKEIVKILLDEGARVDVPHPGDLGQLPIADVLSSIEVDAELVELLYNTGVKQAGSPKRLLGALKGQTFCEALSLRDPAVNGTRRVLELFATGSDIPRTGWIRPGHHFDVSMKVADVRTYAFEALVFVTVQTCINLTDDKNILMEIGRTCKDVDPRYNGLNFKCNP
ncbi:MAG: hypothetical protein ABL958_02910 [Bdellovibrionia bacterium]